MKNKYICDICNKELFSKKSLENHIKWHKGCQCFNKQKNLQLKLQDQKTRYTRKFICEKCKCEFTKDLTDKEYDNYLKSHQHFFCSRSCANTRKHSAQTKQKISRKIKIKQINKTTSKNKIKICKVCNSEYTLLTHKDATKFFCSHECYQYYKKNRKDFLSPETIKKYQECGHKLVAILKDIKRSKNEIAFYELCKKEFNNVVHNEPIFNGWDADIIIHDLKIAILWNGRWHYEKLTKNHSVQQVQNRDKIKINEILKYGYYPYIIKDMGKFSIKKVQSQWQIFNNFLKTQFIFFKK